MAKLNDEELATLKRLREKEKAPDSQPAAVRFNLDLSDDKAYERAVKHGLIDDLSASGGNGDDPDPDPDPDEGPKRRGYFGE